jgi:hypothetical protein
LNCEHHGGPRRGGIAAVDLRGRLTSVPYPLADENDLRQTVGAVEGPGPAGLPDRRRRARPISDAARYVTGVTPPVDAGHPDKR